MMTTDAGFFCAVLVALLLGAVLLTGLIWWKIFGKAGYPEWLSLLMFVPLVNLFALLWLAFGEWPLLAELRRLRAEVRRRDTAPAPAGDFRDQLWQCRPPIRLR
ncbi:MAG: hypothetical protein AB1696_23560 [Planctomycetota bacterium]